MEFEKFSLKIESDTKVDEAETRKHLKEGFKPIMACVGTPEQFLTSRENGNLFRFMARVGSQILPEIHNVDYYGAKVDLEKDGFKIGKRKRDGHNNYVISPTDSLDKFSTKIVDCTGILIAGQDKATGENVSLLTHQNPKIFQPGALRNSFVKDLQQRIEELKNRSAEGSIDAVIVGGNYVEEGSHKQNYTTSIKGLADIVSGVLGFEPTVITGPKMESGADNVFYDNKNRRLYICRPKVGLDSTAPFAPNDLEERRKNW